MRYYRRETSFYWRPGQSATRTAGQVGGECDVSGPSEGSPLLTWSTVRHYTAPECTCEYWCQNVGVALATFFSVCRGLTLMNALVLWPSLTCILRKLVGMLGSLADKGAVTRCL